MHAVLFHRLSDFFSSSRILTRPRPDFSTAIFNPINSATRSQSRSESSSHVLYIRAFDHSRGESVLSARYHFFRQRKRLSRSTRAGGSSVHAVAQQARPL